MSATPFLVYGTLRPGCGNYEWALAGRTTTEIDVILPGFRMYAAPSAGFPYVTRGTAKDSIVATLVTVSEDVYEDTLESLDMLEGYISPTSRNNHYDRVLVDVKVEGEVRKAYIYLASEKVASRLDEKDVIKKGDWIREVARRRFVKGLRMAADKGRGYFSKFARSA